MNRSTCRHRVYLILVVISLIGLVGVAEASDRWAEFSGQQGPGQGKKIVLIAGDEEYRSEEALPMLARILATHHGFDCVVLFSLDPESGEIDPENQTNIPGIKHLADADMMIIATRFRELPDEDMRVIDQYVHSGRPILGLRTATHAFRYSRNKNSPYAHYGFNSSEWPGGFGQQVLGETWVNHHGHHKVESTRGVINPQQADHPILRGVEDVWGPTDVYGIKNLPDSANVLMFGSVLEGMDPSDPPIDGPKNDPMMPLFWTKTFEGRSGKTSRIVCTTMGSSTDLACEDLRRAVVNGVYWALEMEDQIPEESNVEIVGAYEPSPYGHGDYRRGVKPDDLQ